MAYIHEQIRKIKNRIPDADDKMLEQMLEDAKEEILDFCNRTDLPERASGLWRELAIEYYNRANRAGVTSRSEGAISESYTTEIPAGIKSRLSSYRLLKAVNVANESEKPKCI